MKNKNKEKMKQELTKILAENKIDAIIPYAIMAEYVVNNIGLIEKMNWDSNSFYYNKIIGILNGE